MSLLKLLKAAQNRAEPPVPEEPSKGDEAVAASEAASTSGRSDGQPAPSLKGFGRKMSVWSTVARKLSVSTNASGKAATVKPAAPKRRFENTYRTEPTSGAKFDQPRVERFLFELLEMRLKAEKYEARTCSSLTTSLADVIKARMKKMGFARHRIVVYVVVGEKRDQGLQACGRCVWDENTDNFVTITYENSSLFVVASVYGVYYE